MFTPNTKQRRPVPALILANMAVLACTQLPQASAGPPTITNLGVLPNGISSEGYDVTLTPSGSPVVVGVCFTPGAFRAFVWTQDEGMVDLAPFPGASRPAGGLGLNADATTVVGYSTLNTFDRPTRWVKSRQDWVGQDLGILPGASGHSVALDITDDGLFAVGYSPSSSPNSPRAVGWDIGDGTIVNFGVMSGGTYTFGSAVSADGSAAAGEGDTPDGQRAFRWTPADGCQSLGVLEGGNYSFASDISADGNVVVGLGDNADGSQRAWQYDTRRASMFDLGLYPGATSSAAAGTNADGSAVVGRATAPGGFGAWFWTEETEMVSLQTHLTNLGADLTGWTLQRAEAISRDGSAITGTGLFNGQTRAFLISGLPSCTPEITFTGGATTACAGENAFFRVDVAAKSGTLLYTWRRNGIPIDVLTNPTAFTNRLELEAVTVFDTGIYDCVVTNSCGNTTSAPIEFTVLPPHHPDCDSCVGDYNDDGALNSQDFFDFLSDFFTLGVDFNDDGFANSQDFFDFLVVFFLGC